jgi:hypothetical protein
MRASDVINIGYYAGQDNPRGAPSGRRDLRRASPGENRVWAALRLATGVALDWLTYWLRLRGDRWFAANDTEADWWGWQITKTRGGLARGYRDPRFDTPALGSLLGMADRGTTDRSAK